MEEAEYEKMIWAMKRPLQLFGCWPYAWSGERAYRVAVLGGLLLLASACSLEVGLFWGEDMNETVECSLVTSAFYMAVLRFAVLSRRRGELLFVLEAMRADWLRPRRQPLLAADMRPAFRLAGLFALNVLAAGGMFALGPALEQLLAGAEMPASGRRPLPFRGYFLFNHSSSRLVYGCVYAGNALFGALGCSTIAGATGFSLLSTMHAAAKFAMVQRRFLECRTPAQMASCVREHQRCIQFAETVEKIINLLALAQFVVSTGLVCFAGFQLTTMLQDRTRLTKYTCFLNAAIFELFIFSYSGQSLKSQSEAVADFVYSSDWLGMQQPRSNDIQIIIMRARRACTITAGKFYDMSLESFIKVMSSSFSYLTVLLTMQDNN